MTTTASWRSSDTAIATVNAAGFVTGVGNGNADITATFQNLSASARVTVSGATFTITGTIFDGTSRGVLPNIAVELSDESGALRNGLTSSAGTYSFGPVRAGLYTISASHIGYLTASRHVTVPFSTQADIVLPRLAAPPGGGPLPTTVTRCASPQQRREP